MFWKYNVNLKDEDIIILENGGFICEKLKLALVYITPNNIIIMEQNKN